MELIVNALLQLPVADHFHKLARYYQIHVLGNVGDNRNPISSLEAIADKLHWQYKPRALCALAMRNLDQGNVVDAAEFYIQAAKAARGFDLLSEIQALRGFAILQSSLGDHQSALTTLRGLASQAFLLREAFEPEYLAYLNSVSMELAELGRVGEANAVIDYVLSTGTKIGHLLDGWVDTKQEVLAKIGQPAPPLVFAFSRPLEETQESVAAVQTTRSAARDSQSSNKKFFSAGVPLAPACLPTKRSRVRLLAAKPQFLLPLETRPGSSHSPRAPPAAR